MLHVFKITYLCMVMYRISIIYDIIIIIIIIIIINTYLFQILNLILPNSN